MEINNKLIEYMSLPQENTKIDGDKLNHLRILFDGFDFNSFDGYYNFIYENIEINISINGTVLISLVSASNISENITMLSKLLNKINSLISIAYFSKRIRIHDLSA